MKKFFLGILIFFFIAFFLKSSSFAFDFEVEYNNRNYRYMFPDFETAIPLFYYRTYNGNPIVTLSYFYTSSSGRSGHVNNPSVTFGSDVECYVFGQLRTFSNIFYAGSYPYRAAADFVNIPSSMILSDHDAAVSFASSYSSSSYDDNIGALMNLDMSIVYKLSTGVQARLNWNMPDNVDHVKLVITGSKQTNTYVLNGLSYWFNLSDYGNLDDTVHVYLTPYDSDGNWGNTMTISTVVDPVISSYLAQSYKGYYRRVTNPAGSGYVDIIGTSDIDVEVIEEKPDSSGSVTGSPTIVRNYHSYSPVFEYNTTNENYYQEVINYYVTNNNVVNNYYYTTVNNIDLSTSITVDYDAYFDIDNVTQTCEDIKEEIHQTGNDFSDLFLLFDVVCPFFAGVGAKAFTLFKWVIGIVGGFVGIKILKAFL